MMFTASSLTSMNMNIIMATGGLEYVAVKSLDITDSGITGKDTNSSSGIVADPSGIKYYNGMFALRYVIGV